MSYECREMRRSREPIIIFMVDIPVCGETVFISKQGPQPSCFICATIVFKSWFNTPRPRQNGRYFQDFFLFIKFILLCENGWSQLW